MSPPRVDFYLIASPEPGACFELACRLIEKAWLRKHRVFVLAGQLKDAETLDELLWTFKPQSFIPHNLQGEGPEPPPPVQIGCAEPRGFDDILINLTETVPAWYSRFRRIIEIIGADDALKQTGRIRYKHYRDGGCTPETHSLDMLLTPS